MRKLILVALLLAPLAGGCHRNGDVIDSVKPGTPVTITTTGGQAFSGQLAEARADAVVLQTPGGGPPVTIPRSQIASLTVSTRPEAQPGQTPPTLPQSASAPPQTPAPGTQAPTGSPQPTPGRAQALAGGPPSATASSPSSPPAPQWREVVVPAGTTLSIQLDEGVSSDRSRPEEPVRATLVDDVEVGGHTVIPAGSAVTGTVTAAKPSGKVKGVAELAVRFHSVTPKGSSERYDVRTGLVARRARTTHKKDALEIGGGAAGGALLGGLLGGKKGALIGTTVGGGAGTAVVLSTKGQEVRLPTGTRLAIKLLEPVTVRVPA